ncbi:MULTISPECIES: hypothetical protein [Mycolicibacterium]|jgi:hypothetical protein|uniref:Uncharacterized protein n=3 Tax=Mycolicibacterium TaxID=1866885 RepID=A0A378T3M0_9MYCO|nr:MULTISPECIES: hypothetical protein [Mycolicibacterium]KLI07484.1 hypothetical protein AA982_14490 [Mycolicibacterium senegalense]KLO50797.1 hypothetical protein ABW05_04085 [Mycolicibacterium senegalense]KMV15851.1 hypothetical protein ACT17_23485 [Mycolicibacterium conceptionense]MCV7338638.1 hypothetical protein [Mycolicibacterium senegalense]MCW1820565.1 hypothetical protein [Mycolicibacterium senegalense]
MPTIYAASESTVLVDGEPIEGVQGIDYRTRHERTNIYALGSTERVGVVSGAYEVQGRIRVTSASAKLDALGGEQMFQIIANLRHGDTEATVTFDDCCLTEKTFDLSVNGQGAAVYAFSAARMR